MKRILMGLVAASLTLSQAATGSSSRLGLVATELSGRPTSVSCQRLSGWLGYAEIAPDRKSGRILLALDVCAALKTKRIIRPPYPRVSTGEAVITLAHEAGHIHGLYDEDKAYRFAWHNLGRTALLLGYARRDLPQIVEQARIFSDV